MATSPSSFLQVDGSGAGGGADDVRTQFRTREGVYRVMKHSEYSRPTRTPQNGPGTTPFRVAFVGVPDPYNRRIDDILAFIVGKELYVYYYNGIRKAADLTRPIEKKTYRGPSPTCHDFNQFMAASDRLMLVVGFTLGQIQLIEPMIKEYSKLFNEERLIDNTKVTCIQWVPGSPNHFIAAHASGQLYVYDERLPCGAAPPVYQLFKQGTGYSVHTCRAKSTRNPLYRWLIDSAGAIHAIAFSPCTHFLAVACADGQLHIFNYDQMELIGTMKSYFGGLRCVAWSPDGRYVATGGEDDLVTIWSALDRKVVCRGSGHRSWVSGVAFDPYTCTIPGSDFKDSNSPMNATSTCATDVTDEKTTDSTPVNTSQISSPDSCQSLPAAASEPISVTSYRLGTVGDDALLCLWEITEDVLNSASSPRSITAKCQQRTNSVAGIPAAAEVPAVSNGPVDVPLTVTANHVTSNHPRPPLLTSSSESSGLSQKFASLSVSEQHRAKEPAAAGGATKRPFGTLAARTSDTRLLFSRSSKASSANGTAGTGDSNPAGLTLGSPSCPCLTEVPLVQPFICKKVAHERLTAIAFREDCFVLACQDGVVSTWARPAVLTKNGYI